MIINSESHWWWDDWCQRQHFGSVLPGPQSEPPSNAARTIASSTRRCAAGGRTNAEVIRFAGSSHETWGFQISRSENGEIDWGFQGILHFIILHFMLIQDDWTIICKVRGVPQRRWVINHGRGLLLNHLECMKPEAPAPPQSSATSTPLVESSLYIVAIDRVPMWLVEQAQRLQDLWKKIIARLAALRVLLYGSGSGMMWRSPSLSIFNGCPIDKRNCWSPITCIGDSTVEISLCQIPFCSIF